MDYNDINKTALYVLKIDNQGEFYTDFYPIDKSLLKELDVERIYEILDDNSYHQDKNLNNTEKEKIHKEKQQSVLEFFKELFIKHEYLFEKRDYCLNLGRQDGRFKSLRSVNCFELSPYKENVSYNTFLIINNVHCEANFVKLFIEEFFDSYFIEEAYKKCKKDTTIKAYSHRYNGWQTVKFPLNKDLSVNFNTNFGYGYASYFTITLIYKGIQIIPYSRLVLYRFVNLEELVKNTREYFVSNESWDLALDFIRDACNNLLIDGNESFIGKYMVDECETLVSYLTNYMQNDTFNLYEKIDGRYSIREIENIKQASIKLNGYDLIIFRANKVANAIYFTDSIKALNIVMPTQKYLDKINDCCRIALKQLNENIEEIILIIDKKEIEDRKNCDKRDVAKNKLNEVKPMFEKRNNDYNVICKEILEINKDIEGYQSIYSVKVEKDATNKVKEIYSDWEDFNKKYNGLQSEFNSIDKIYQKNATELEQLEKYRDEMNENKEKIETYLAKNMLDNSKTQP